MCWTRSQKNEFRIEPMNHRLKVVQYREIRIELVDLMVLLGKIKCILTIVNFHGHNTPSFKGNVTQRSFNKVRDSLGCRRSREVEVVVVGSHSVLESGVDVIGGLTSEVYVNTGEGFRL